MMIMKFNKMIRNKVVWWIIGGIVIITFVGWFTPQGGCDTAKPANDIGSLDGKPVSDAELRHARFNTYLSVCLSMGRIPNMTPLMDRELRDMAWRRIAALRAAEELKLTASLEEVLAAITSDPQFQDEGRFNPQRYQVFGRDVLSRLNATLTQFEQQLRENIVLQKLHNITSAGIWLAPSELRRMSARYADSFKLEYVDIDTNLISAKAITLTESDLHSYYKAHSNEFRVPAKVSVRYLQLPISNYLSKVTDKVDTNTVEDYYLAHTDDYSTTDTNDAKVVKPLEAVSQEISVKLLHEAATQMAADTLNELSDTLIPNREGKASTFEAIAQSAHLPILETGLFDAFTPVTGIDAGLAFNEAAFRLRSTADEYFSMAIPGKDSVFLMALSTNTDAYIPQFAKVKEQVEPLALENAIQESLHKQAADLHQFLQAGLSSKRSFASLAKEKSMNVSTTEYFSASAAPDALSSSDILGDITLRNAGELSAVLPGTSGLMIAYIVDRRPAGQAELGSIQNQVFMNTNRRRSRIIFNDWEKSLVSGERMKDKYKPEDIQDIPASDDQDKSN
jgi:peptidyl-prolyl cis-trans isomerase D